MVNPFLRNLEKWTNILKNLAVFTQQEFLSTLNHFTTLCMKISIRLLKTDFLRKVFLKWLVKKLLLTFSVKEFLTKKLRITLNPIQNGAKSLVPSAIPKLLKLKQDHPLKEAIFLVKSLIEMLEL